MPKVGGKSFKYNEAGMKAADKARKTLPAQANARASAAGGNRSPGKPASRTLPAQASPTARKNAFGKMGAAKRKR